MLVVVERQEYDRDGFNSLYDRLWGGAISTMDCVSEADKEEEFMELLEAEFFGDEVGETELNDFIAYESNFIFKELGLDENGELIEDDDESEDDEL